MWIIPKNLHTSLSVLDTEALTSDSEELSELFAQSLLARSSLSPAKTWSRRLKQGSLTLLPYGRILKPSLGQRFVDQWTSSLEASLASRSAPQVSVEETTTQDTFGRTSCEALESLDTLPLFSLRTSRGSSAQSSQVTSGVTPQVRPFCSMSSVSWSAWVTAQRQDYSQRAKLASPISVNECSSWVFDATSHTISVSGCHRSSEQETTTWKTPVTSEHRVQGSHEYHVRMAQREKASWKLSTQAVLSMPSEAQTWPTPTTQETHHADITLTHTGRRASKTGGGSYSLNLADTATLAQPTPHQEARISTDGSHQESQGKAWATPTVTEAKAIASLEYHQKRARKLKQTMLHGQITLDAQQNMGKLNPRWVETLMGLPVGWTMRSCATPWAIEQMNCACSETESSPLPQSERSECSGQGCLGQGD